jgi:hypothetical protein
MAIIRVTTLLVAFILSMATATSQAAGLTIFSSTGTEPDPLTSPFPLSVHAGETRSVGVLLATTQGRGYVLPTVTCCTDMVTGAQVSPTGLSINFVPLASIVPLPPGFLVSSAQDTIAPLVVSAAAGTAPGTIERIGSDRPRVRVARRGLAVDHGQSFPATKDVQARVLWRSTQDWRYPNYRGWPLLSCFNLAPFIRLICFNLWCKTDRSTLQRLMAAARSQ